MDKGQHSSASKRMLVLIVVDGSTHCWYYMVPLIVHTCTVDVKFDNQTGDYYPIVYFNDFWNLASEYTPINETTP